MVSGRGWIQGLTSCFEGCLESSFFYTIFISLSVSMFVPQIYIHMYLSTCMRVCIYIYMNEWKYVCMYVQNERVCHGVSYRFWAKMWHPEDPPTSFRSPKKHVGQVYFTWSGEIFLRNFMPYPPPKKIQG